MSRPLVRVLGVGFGLAVTIGNTIAAGILRTPGDVAASFPEPALVVGIWLLGAAYAFLGANAIAELGTMLPRSGAQFIFARHTFGDRAPRAGGAARANPASGRDLPPPAPRPVAPS